MGESLPEKQARILLISSDPTTAVTIRGSLSRAGYLAECVTSGALAMARIQERPPDLCLVSLDLPDQDGMDLLRKVRGEHPDVPLIALSRSSSVQDAVVAIKLGACDYLPQPVDGQKLLLAVQDALQLSWQRAELERLRNENVEDEGRLRVDEILTDLVVRNASDLHLKVGRPPLYRIAGELVPGTAPPLEEKEIQEILKRVLGPTGYRSLEETFEFDASYVISDIARFRVNAFKRMGQFGATFRVIPLATPAIDALGLPPILKDICRAPQGMVLVTGPTGSGKSTTLAAMIDHLNQTESLHIVTIEDPIEFVYTDKKSTITQRQLGSDVKSLNEALRRVLRQDPDVILMGEMRDPETIELAMHAAETGHLVFSTLHTNDAKQTLDRIVDTFPPEAHSQIRSMLALTLQAVVSQRLIRRADGTGRIAAVEIMINSPNVRDLIAEGKTSQIEKVIASSNDYYKMQTFNQALVKLINDGVVTQDEALAISSNPSDLKLALKGISGGSMMSTRDASPASPKQSDTTKLKITRSF